MAKDKAWFYGIQGIEFVWHGEWSDPTLIYKGREFNYYDIETPMWEIYKEDCEEAGTNADEDEFAVWMQENGDYVRSYMDDIMMVGV